jgi:hypothetical protein
MMRKNAYLPCKGLNVAFLAIIITLRKPIMDRLFFFIYEGNPCMDLKKIIKNWPVKYMLYKLEQEFIRDTISSSKSKDLCIILNQFVPLI